VPPAILLFLFDHVNCFDALQCSPCAPKRTLARGEPGSFLHVSMVLFDHIIKILPLPELNAAQQTGIGFQGLHGRRVRRVFVDIHDPRLCTPGRLRGLYQKAFGRGSVPPRQQQKLDGLASGVQRTIQVPVLALDPDAGLVDPLRLVRRTQMWTAAFVDPGEYACTQGQMQLASIARRRSASISARADMPAGNAGTSARPAE
jgi:hypothetical protein